jgi:hypothetical protein
MHTIGRLAFAATACAVAQLVEAQGGDPAGSVEPIQIYKPTTLFKTPTIPAARTPLGLPGDYKPWVAEVKPGELLVVAFCSPCSGPHNASSSKAGKNEEHALFWRSTDSGKTSRRR